MNETPNIQDAPDAAIWQELETELALNAKVATHLNRESICGVLDFRPDPDSENHFLVVSCTRKPGHQAEGKRRHSWEA